MGFSRQEYWSGLPCPPPGGLPDPPGGLPDPGIQPESPAVAGGLFTAESPGKPQHRDDSGQIILRRGGLPCASLDI